MKNPSAIARKKLHAARQWVFRWRGLDGTPLRGLLALMITAGGFSLFAATVRIRVSAPQQWVERKASIIHLPAGGDGRIWAIRALESGPFPSRFDPAEWRKASGFEDPSLGATRLSPTPYEPKLRDLPEQQGIAPIQLAARGERVFPKRLPAAAISPPETPSVRLVPRIYPLSGISREGLPADLPAFGAEITPAMASAPWRFLVRLRPDGTVLECDAMPDQAGGEALKMWIKTFRFTPELAKRAPWISLGVGFSNQPAHGPEPR